MREYQVRICEGLGVKFPGPTRRQPVEFSSEKQSSLGRRRRIRTNHFPVTASKAWTQSVASGCGRCAFCWVSLVGSVPEDICRDGERI